FYALTLAGVFLFASLIDWLAPRFGAERNYRQAFKVSAYSITAAMIAGIATVVPALQIFALLGSTYSLFLLFIGAPKLMHAPDKSSVNFSIVATFSAIVLALGVGLAVMAVVAPSGNPFPQIAAIPDLLASPEKPATTVKANTDLPPSAGELI